MTHAASLLTPGFAFVEGALDRADELRDNRDALHAYWPNARVLLIDSEPGAGALFRVWLPAG